MDKFHLNASGYGQTTILFQLYFVLSFKGISKRILHTY